jgi:hypothetical protein
MAAAAVTDRAVQTGQSVRTNGLHLGRMAMGIFVAAIMAVAAVAPARQQAVAPAAKVVFALSGEPLAEASAHSRIHT